MDLKWMAWTLQTALFFAGIASLLVAYTVWGVVSPSAPRRGLLPMPTTRGDRFFIGLLATAFIHMAWLALTMASPWWALAASAAVMAAIGRWG